MNSRHLALVLLLGAKHVLHGQATPTASRRADAQIGVGFTLGPSGYAPQSFRGISAYVSLDLTPHLGAELAFHQINSPSGDRSYQRTYELGARYLRTYRALKPYLRASYGRGDFNYPYGLTDLSYNLVSGAVGADYKMGDRLRLRADFEYQNWFGFTNGGLHPQLVSFGAAYHFTGRPRYD